MGATRRTGRKTNLVLEETKADGTKRQRLVNRETLCSVLCFYEEALEELQEVGAKAKDADCIRWREGKEELTFIWEETMEDDATDQCLPVEEQTLSFLRQFLEDPE